MSFYISASQVPRSVPEPQKFIPFLWNGPEFSLQHRIFPSEHELGQLIMDSFEISNSSGATMSYPILPFGGLRAVFLFSRGLTRAELCSKFTFSQRNHRSRGIAVYGPSGVFFEMPSASMGTPVL